MNKKSPLLLIILFASIFTACSSNVQPDKGSVDISSQDLKNQEKISASDLEIIKRFNEILKKLATDSSGRNQKQLQDFIPEALKISNTKEKNSILMNIYLQTKMYSEALKLNTAILKVNPDNVSNQKFQCLLLKTLGNPNQSVKTCYIKLSNLIKKQLNASNSQDSMYPYIEWSYYAAMYHAGNDEYKDKLKKVVDLQTNEENKLQFDAMYEAEISEQQLP